MNKEELTNFIKENMEVDDFTDGVDGKLVDYVQETLGLNLPESYKWFLTNYGSGGIFGVDILGVAKSNIASVVIETESYRKLGMERSLVVIEDMGEYAYCLDVSNMKKKECPIKAWNSPGGLDDYNTAENFFDFLSQRLLEAKEAWEEDF